MAEDGFYAEQEIQPLDGPKMKQRVVQKIPERVIKNAKGLAIFTTMRTGLWISGAGGSGVLVARQADGTWSPPSGILLHTAGLGFLVGVDIYDCVLVLNSDAAVAAFTKIRCTLGSEISVVAGPVGAGGILETEIHKRQAPIYTYMKSRGFYAGVQIDGTVIIERNDENERFYGYALPVKDIIGGKVRHPPYELKMLTETLKAAQGDTQFDASALPSEPPPGDYVLEDGKMFGVPDKEDPDPYGVLALEKEGLSLKEAGSQKRASWEEFSFHPAPTSPLHSIYTRQTPDDASRAPGSSRSSWRASVFASHEPKSPSSLRNSMDVSASSSVKLVETSTQTDASLTQNTDRRSRQSSHVGSVNTPHTVQLQEVPELEAVKDLEPTNTSTANGISTPPHTPPFESTMSGHRDSENVDDDLDDEFDAHIEETVVHTVQTAQPTAPTAISKARLVSVPKRGPPPMLPPRNPTRRGPLIIDASPKQGAPLAERDEMSSAVDHSLANSAPHVEKESTAEVESIQDELETIELRDEEDAELHNEYSSSTVEAMKGGESQSHKIPGGFD